MNAAGLVSVILLAAGFVYTWRNRGVDRPADFFEPEFRLAPEAPALILTDDLTLVTASGVEIPYAEGWGFDDVMQTLADIDRLPIGGTN